MRPRFSRYSSDSCAAPVRPSVDSGSPGNSQSRDSRSPIAIGSGARKGGPPRGDAIVAKRLLRRDPGGEPSPHDLAAHAQPVHHQAAVFKNPVPQNFLFNDPRRGFEPLQLVR